MTFAPTLRITNYAFAVGRIGLAVLFVPLLAAIGGLTIAAAVEGPRANTGDNLIDIAFGVVLLLISLLILWLGLTTPTSLQVDEQITVNYLCHTRKYSLEDVKDLSESRETTSLFTPGTVIGSWFYGYTSQSTCEYKVCILRLKNGKPIKFKVTAEQLTKLRAHISPPNIPMYTGRRY